MNTKPETSYNTMKPQIMLISPCGEAITVPRTTPEEFLAAVASFPEADRAQILSDFGWYFAPNATSKILENL